MRQKYPCIYQFEQCDGLHFDENQEDSMSRTVQGFKDECDINNIVSKYNQTGLWYDIHNPPKKQAQFGDFTNYDFQANQNKIATIRNDFSNLPVTVRAKFNHSVEVMLDYLANPENKEEAVKLGLLPHEQINQPETVIPTVSVNDALQTDASASPEA